MVVVFGTMRKKCVLLEMKQDSATDTHPFQHLGSGHFCCDLSLLVQVVGGHREVVPKTIRWKIIKLQGSLELLEKAACAEPGDCSK